MFGEWDAGKKVCWRGVGEESSIALVARAEKKIGSPYGKGVLLRQRKALSGFFRSKRGPNSFLAKGVHGLLQTNLKKALLEMCN
jgi:hypothetical protein